MYHSKIIYSVLYNLYFVKRQSYQDVTEAEKKIEIKA
jgi:hypothetical protein